MCRNCQTAHKAAELNLEARAAELAARQLAELPAVLELEQPAAPAFDLSAELAATAPQRTFGAIVGMEPVVPQAPMAEVMPDGAVCDCGEEAVDCIENVNYCDSCRDDNFKECNECNEWVASDDAKQDSDGDDYCESCFDDKFIKCHSCDCVVSKDDSRSVDGGQDYCDECFNETYDYCEGCDEYVESGDMNKVHETSSRSGRVNEVYRCDGCVSNGYTKCDDCGEYHSDGSLMSTNGGSDICQGCYENGNYFSCEGCNEIFSDSDLGSTEDGCYCTGCAPEVEHDEDADECECSDCRDERRSAARRRTTAEREAAAREAAAAELAAAERKAAEAAARLARLTFDVIKSRRSFGVELETASCDDYHGITDHTQFSGKADGTIDGKEFVSEVLNGDEGLEEITKLCKFAGQHDWTVDAKCGFHAHFDAGDLNDDQRKAVAIAYKLTYNAWSSFVSKSRRANDYAGPSEFEVADCANATSFTDWADSQDRYQWMNFSAYTKHGTFECRMHSGTLNASKVRNWVVAHVRFIDVVSTMTVDEVRAKFEGQDAQTNFAALAEIWNDAALTEFYASRACKFGTVYTQAAGTDFGSDDEANAEFAVWNKALNNTTGARPQIPAELAAV